jgi:calcineurin-like phosphoesterase family protein
MPKTFCVADWHLGETRMEILQRPFKDQRHHIEELLRLHNDIVAPEDMVIVAGDVCYQKTPEFLPEVGRFNGKKVLIRGNHDRPISDDDFGKYFDEIQPDGGGISPLSHPELIVEGIPCYVTHYPTQGESDLFNLVGHIHSIFKYQLNMFNVGVDTNHFLPVDLATIPFHFKAICEFYDEDAWAAYHSINEQYKGKRGKKGRYFNPKD